MKHVFYTDLDGTLFVYTPYVHAPETSINEAIAWMNEGHFFSIATGRNVSDVKLYMGNIKSNLPFVLSNGTVVYDVKQDKVLYKDTLDKEYVKEALEYAKDKPHIIPCFSTPYENIMFENNGVTKTREVTFQHRLVSLKDLDQYEFTKMVFFVSKEHHEDVLEDLKKFKTFDKMNIQPSGVNFIDVINKGTNKASGIRKALELSNITNYKIYAIGDYLNDVEMLKEADVSFAPRNAHHDVLAIADYIVEANTEHGVYEALVKSREKIKATG